VSSLKHLTPCSKIEQALKELSKLQRFYAKIPKINQRDKSGNKKGARKTGKSK